MGKQPAASSVQVNERDLGGGRGWDGYVVTMSLTWICEDQDEADSLEWMLERELGNVARKVARQWPSQHDG